jgi:hypothetical protein
MFYSAALLDGFMMPLAFLLGLLSFRWPKLRFDLSDYSTPRGLNRAVYGQSLLVGALGSTFLVLYGVVIFFDWLLNFSPALCAIVGPISGVGFFALLVKWQRDRSKERRQREDAEKREQESLLEMAKLRMSLKEEGDTKETLDAKLLHELQRRSTHKQRRESGADDE